MNSKILVAIFFLLFVVHMPDSFAQLEVQTNSKVYSTDHNLQVLGTGLPNENLILRLFAPDETIAKFDQITTNDDGSFNYSLLTWPEPSPNFPYGTYTVEVISTEQNGISKKIDVKFSSTTDLMDVPVERNVNTLVFAPETAAINCEGQEGLEINQDELVVEGEGGPCIISAGGCEISVEAELVSLTGCSTCIDTRGNSSVEIETDSFECVAEDTGIRAKGWHITSFWLCL